MKSIKVEKVDLKKINFLVFPIGKIRKLIFLFFILFNCISFVAQDGSSNISEIYISEGTEVVGLNHIVIKKDIENENSTPVIVFVTKGTSFFVPSDKLHNIDKVVYDDGSSQKTFLASEKVNVEIKGQGKVEQKATATCFINNPPLKTPFSSHFQTNKFVVISTSSSFSFQKISCQQIVDFSLDRFVITVSKSKIKQNDLNFVCDKIVDKFTTRPPPFLS